MERRLSFSLQHYFTFTWPR